MPGRLNSARRVYELYCLAGMPAEICGGYASDRDDILKIIREDYPGFKEAVRKWVMSDAPRPGHVFKGNRSLVVCVR